ncbi:MAG: hypothetical protein JNM18_11245 [Planctomycetaceae bacterium]|nr:hypothetical protein [Planctomycetaceae bacterium]
MKSIPTESARPIRRAARRIVGATQSEQFPLFRLSAFASRHTQRASVSSTDIVSAN